MEGAALLLFRFLNQLHELDFVISLPLLLHEHRDPLALPVLLAHGLFSASLVVLVEAGADVFLVILVNELVIVSIELRPGIVLLLWMFGFSWLLVFEKVVELGRMGGVIIGLITAIPVLVVDVLPHDPARHPLLDATRLNVYVRNRELHSRIVSLFGR